MIVYFEGVGLFKVIAESQTHLAVKVFVPGVKWTRIFVLKVLVNNCIVGVSVQRFV